MEPRNLNRHWERLRERLGMKKVRLHDLWHTMVSLLLDLGVPPHIVQHWRGTRTWRSHSHQPGRDAAGGEAAR